MAFRFESLQSNKVFPLLLSSLSHTRYTMHINHLARNRLISEGGAFTKVHINNLKSY